MFSGAGFISSEAGLGLFDGAPESAGTGKGVSEFKSRGGGIKSSPAGTGTGGWGSSAQRAGADKKTTVRIKISFFTKNPFQENRTHFHQNPLRNGNYIPRPPKSHF